MGKYLNGPTKKKIASQNIIGLPKQILMAIQFFPIGSFHAKSPSGPCPLVLDLLHFVTKCAKFIETTNSEV